MTWLEGYSLPAYAGVCRGEGESVVRRSNTQSPCGKTNRQLATVGTEEVLRYEDHRGAAFW